MRATGKAARSTLVIVGNGMVSHALCAKLVKLNATERYRIIVFGDEPRPAYDRVNLTKFFSGRSAKDLELAPLAWYRHHGICLRVGDSVHRVDRERRIIRTSSGTELFYDQLVFATGSSPFVPPIDGTDLPGVFVYRTIEDLEAIREYSRHVRSAAVLGGGLLGLEAAKALFDLGLETHVVEMAPALMSRQLDAEGAAVLQRKIEALGVHIHLVKRTQSIEAREDKRILHFDRGVALPVEMVVVSAGIRPRDELARDCGLELGSRGGIVVNDQLATSDPRIFALGECALHQGTIYGLVAPGYQMAEVLADSLMGGEARFVRGDQSARLKLLGVDVATLGEPLGETPNVSTITWQDEEAFRKLLIQKGRVVGVMSVGPWTELDRIRQTIAAGRRLWGWNISRFESTGHLWRTGSTHSVAEWPETATVCSCLNVTRGTLSSARKQGCATVEALAAQTGASTVCGSCTPLLCQLIGAESVSRARGGKGLLVASLLAVCAIMLWLIGPVPFSQTVNSVWHNVDFIWRDGFWKQVTGFTLLGVSAVGLLLSLRKRWKWLSFGDFGYWRTAHSVVGVLTLAGLLVHTGLHLGSNLNFVLAATFLGLNLVGAATGAMTACEYRATGETAMLLRRWRPRVTRLHIWFFLPLPALLVIHVACVYYY